MRRAAFAGAAVAFAMAAFVSCGAPDAPNPFGGGGAGGAGGAASAGGGGGIVDAGPDADPSLGGPCVDDAQCDDGIACTFDACDTTLGRCRFTPDDTQCDDGVYCNGVEVCKNSVGCAPGLPVTCDDGDTCTIDVCDELTHGCHNTPRDVDGDGDPDIHCGGGDCDDTDPTVNSKTPEICGNGKDDNCNGATDEQPCVAPANDTCLDPLVIDHAGTFAMSTVGAAFDYPTSCGIAPNPGASDVIAALVLAPGPRIDVEVTATVASGAVSVAIAQQCGDPSGEIACGPSYAALPYGALARMRAHGIGDAAAMTTFPIYVATDHPTPVTLAVRFLAEEVKATNETCGTAAPIVVGVPESVEILDAALDLGSACVAPLGELVYGFTLTTPSDVDVYGTSIDGTGIPQLSLRAAACSLPEDEIACSFTPKAHVFRHALPAGDYFVSVAASAPTYVDLEVEVSPPTTPPPDETCVGAPVLAPNKTLSVDLALHQDDVDTGCLAGAADAAYELDLAQASDVLLVERISQGDTAAVELASATCSPTSGLACDTSTVSPLRAARHNVPAGSYRVIAESVGEQPVELTAFVRPAVPPTQVLFADACADAFAIPADGGFFQGNTANARADYPAGCDQSNGLPNGGPEQMLKLVLPAKKRVVFDMSGSSYETLLDVRQGPSCPGTEVPLGCTIGYPGSLSYLDLTLDAGTYFIQVDGYAGDAGAWFLDVRVVDP